MQVHDRHIPANSTSRHEETAPLQQSGGRTHPSETVHENRVDQVRVSGLSRLVSNAMQTAPADRVNRVDELRSAIQTGRYEVDIDRLSSALAKEVQGG